MSFFGRSWSAQFKIRKFKAEIRCGWKEFAAENNLKVGDICNFELLNERGVFVCT